MKCLVKLSVAPGINYEAAADVEMALRPGRKVLMQCDYYRELAVVKCVLSENVPDTLEALEERRARQSKGRHVEGTHLPQVLRLATPDELRAAAKNALFAESVHAQCVSRINFYNLSMKLLATHVSLDRSMAYFQFCSEGRVDFRELLRDLSHRLKMRIELRQVGVRDEAAILGGIGTCGRPLCCHTFMNGLSSVNVKMAKQQGLTLNPQNISGTCGRLKCCLQFELGSEHASENKHQKHTGHNGKPHRHREVSDD